MRTITVAMLCGLFISGCGKNGGDTSGRITSKELNQVQMARTEVKLPPPPTFKKDHAPRLYPDQTLSIYGLRQGMKTLKGQVVRVKAYLLEVYECPKCAKGAQCKTCRAPHFWLSDRKNGPKDKALLVTDYPKKDPKTRRKLKFEQGMRYVVTGIFRKRSGTGFSNADGLLVYQESAKPTEE